jgi:hypothetical protein
MVGMGSAQRPAGGDRTEIGPWSRWLEFGCSPGK